MKLYIANGTTQDHDFVYRLQGGPGARVQRIPVGQQIALAGDLDPNQIDQIISQHSKYGLVPAEKIDQTRPFAGLCYAVDKPVAATKIETLIRHNKDVLVERGKQIRQELAVASAKFSQEATAETPALLNNFEITIQEETYNAQSETSQVAEGIRVAKEPSAEMPRAPRRSKR